MANLWSSDPWMCWVQECEGEDWLGGDHWVGQGCSSMQNCDKVKKRNWIIWVKASLGLNLLPFCLSLLDTGSWAWGFFLILRTEPGFVHVKVLSPRFGVCECVLECVNVYPSWLQIDCTAEDNPDSISLVGVTGVHPPYLDPKFWCVFVFVYFWAGVLLCNPDWPGTHK